MQAVGDAVAASLPWPRRLLPSKGESFTSEGERLPSRGESFSLPGEEEEARFIDSLPLIEVARSWKIEVVTYSGSSSGALGYFSPGQIGLGVRNPSTWAHEMIHAADLRLATISRGRGQQLDNEIVAEFGGAVLLECLGLSTESDRGGAFEYIQCYCRKHERPLISAVTELVDRTCNCVALILQTADDLKTPADIQQVA